MVADRSRMEWDLRVANVMIWYSSALDHLPRGPGIALGPTSRTCTGRARARQGMNKVPSPSAILHNMPLKESPYTQHPCSHTHTQLLGVQP